MSVGVWSGGVASYDITGCRESLSSLKVVKKKVFLDERWSQNRNVTAMDWSSHVSNQEDFILGGKEGGGVEGLLT